MKTIGCINIKKTSREKSNLLFSLKKHDRIFDNFQNREKSDFPVPVSVSNRDRGPENWQKEDPEKRKWFGCMIMSRLFQDFSTIKASLFILEVV